MDDEQPSDFTSVKPGQTAKEAFAEISDMQTYELEEVANNVWRMMPSIQPSQIAAVCRKVIADHYGFKPETAEKISKLVNPLHGHAPVQRNRLNPPRQAL